MDPKLPPLDGIYPEFATGGGSSARSRRQTNNNEGAAAAMGLAMVWMFIFFGTLITSLYPIGAKRVAEIPLMHEIPEAIHVEDVEEKFEIIEFRGGLGSAGAGAGGLGAVRIVVNSAEEFRSIAHPDEPIYVTYGNPTDLYGFVQSYFSLIPNRSAIVIYERVYYPDDGEYYSRFVSDGETIVFSDTYAQWRWFGRLRGLDVNIVVTSEKYR